MTKSIEDYFGDYLCNVWDDGDTEVYTKLRGALEIVGGYLAMTKEEIGGNDEWQAIATLKDLTLREFLTLLESVLPPEVTPRPDPVAGVTSQVVQLLTLDGVDCDFAHTPSELEVKTPNGMLMIACDFNWHGWEAQLVEWEDDGTCGDFSDEEFPDGPTNDAAATDVVAWIKGLIA